MIKEIYTLLLKKYGYQNWWPVHKGTDTFLEISIGAILTQNTNWKNVEKVLENLIEADLLNWDSLNQITEEQLAYYIKPAGFYRQKSRTIKLFVGAVKGLKKEEITRDLLLSIKGIGKETADSILLYALERPYFVIDAYTKRIFSRIGICDKKVSYDDLQTLIQNSLPEDINLYKEYHALLVEHAKRHCKKEPVCLNCPLENICAKIIVSHKRF